MDKPIEIKEIGDYRINIYYDTDARCPCTDWDMVACYLWDYPRYNGGLSSACNWEDVFGKYGKNKYNLADALHQLVNDHVKKMGRFAQIFQERKARMLSNEI